MHAQAESSEAVREGRELRVSSCRNDEGCREFLRNERKNYQAPGRSSGYLHKTGRENGAFSGFFEKSKNSAPPWSNRYRGSREGALRLWFLVFGFLGTVPCCRVSSASL